MPEVLIEFMSEAVRSHSSQLQLDASHNKVRANHKRCVVVLREIDKETSSDEIMSLFDKCAEAKCLHCEFAGNRSWYLSFKDEHEAQIAVAYIKEDVQTFKGENLFARIKTHPIPRAAALATAATALPLKQNFVSPLSNADLAPSTTTTTTSDQLVINSDLKPLPPPQSQSSLDEVSDSLTHQPDLVSPQKQQVILPQQQQHHHTNKSKFAKPPYDQTHSNHPHFAMQQQSHNPQYPLGSPANSYSYNQESYKYYLNPGKIHFIYITLIRNYIIRLDY